MRRCVAIVALVGCSSGRSGPPPADASDGGGASPPDAGALCAVAARVGERRVLGILVDVGSTTNACDEGRLERALFSGPESLAAFYRAQSFDQLRFTGDVMRVSLPEITGDCDEAHLVRIAEAAEREAAARGHDPARYAAINYSLPSLVGTRCGLAVTMAGARPRVFNREGTRCDYPNVYWHENAHALVVPGTETGGIGHAGLLMADGRVMLNGDRSSVTGYTPGGSPFNAPERVYAGWLRAEQVHDVAAGGEHTLIDLADPGEGAKVLRVPVAAPVATGAGAEAEPLYLALRRRRDGFEAARPAEYDGVNVHRFTPCPSDYGTGQGGRQVHALLVGVLRAEGDILDHAGVRVTLRRSEGAGAVTVALSPAPPP